MYTVKWLAEAELQLNAIYDAAEDALPLDRALQLLESGLQWLPLQLGFERDSSVHRMNYERPLLIEYYVIEDDKRVEVLSVLEYHGN